MRREEYIISDDNCGDRLIKGISVVRWKGFKSWLHILPFDTKSKNDNWGIILFRWSTLCTHTNQPCIGSDVDCVFGVPYNFKIGYNDVDALMFKLSYLSVHHIK